MKLAPIVLMYLVSVLVFLASVFVGVALADDDSAGWRKLYEERGILVSTREELGRELPSVRGQTLLKAPVLHLLAILLDDRHSTEWAKGADEARVLRSVDSHTQIVYARSHQRWPVQDRDMVMKRTVDVLEPGSTYRVHLVCTPRERPVVSNVIRVRQCETTFVLHAVDAAHTRIDYQMQIDPGGDNPAWMVQMVSKNIPLDTLSSLAKQVERTRGKYTAAVAQWARAN